MRLAVAALFGAAVILAVAMHAAEPKVPLGVELYRPAPSDNRLTPARIALGRRLFFDRRLSRDGTISCASCHEPQRAFTDGRAVAQGIGGARGRRNSPTLVNRAWGSSFFFDGRARSLEDLALRPILDPTELGSTADAVLSLARSNYRSRLRAAFDAEPSLELIAKALASYLRTIVDGNSAFDRFAAGNDSALTMSARRGRMLFTGKAGCGQCHAGPNLTDEEFHNTGVAWRTGVLADEGRAGVTRAAADRGAFKTPTLREISRTAPYMHNGSLATLNDVIEYYDGGGVKNPALDSKVRALKLSPTEKADLAAFLTSLTGQIQEGR
jgi:cytochrome c peroxidase